MLLMVPGFEYTLALFTLLAPTGAVAVVAMALYALSVSARPSAHEGDLPDYQRICRYLIIPLGAAMVGLIASASHLGTPSNALYVLIGWGRSPLSNEVVAALVFLSLTGVFWLVSFRKKLSVAAARVVLAAICVSSIWLVWEISIVYSVRTIITWNTAVSVVALWPYALCGGCVLGAVGLVASRVSVPRRYLGALVAVSALSFVGALVALGVQGAALTTLANKVAVAAEVIPWYGWGVAAFGVCVAMGLALMTWPLVRRRPLRLRRCIVAALAVCAGIYIARIMFYCMHMTAGL